MKYRKRPVIVEAHLFDGSNEEFIIEWASVSGEKIVWDYAVVEGEQNVRVLEIETLEGIFQALPGDWIIKGVAGEFYPCKPDAFVETFDSVTDRQVEVLTDDFWVELIGRIEKMDVKRLTDLRCFISAHLSKKMEQGDQPG